MKFCLSILCLGVMSLGVNADDKIIDDKVVVQEQSKDQEQAQKQSKDQVQDQSQDQVIVDQVQSEVGEMDQAQDLPRTGSATNVNYHHKHHHYLGKRIHHGTRFSTSNVMMPSDGYSVVCKSLGLEENLWKARVMRKGIAKEVAESCCTSVDATSAAVYNWKNVLKYETSCL